MMTVLSVETSLTQLSFFNKNYFCQKKSLLLILLTLYTNLFLNYFVLNQEVKKYIKEIIRSTSRSTWVGKYALVVCEGK